MQNVSFAQNNVTNEFILGTEYIFKIPKLIQEPECNLPVDGYIVSFTNTEIDEEILESIFWLEQDLVYGQSYNFTLFRKTVIVKITPDALLFNRDVV